MPTPSLSPQAQEAVQLLRQLIAVPSLSRQEAGAADVYEHFLLEQGLTPRREGNNVWACAPEPSGAESGKPVLLLNAHLDTVKPVGGWTRDPFTPAIEGDRLYGLGANDCGGGLVALTMAALPYLQGQKVSARWRPVLLASAEEEVSGKDGIERALPLIPAPAAAIVGEPTGMQPATSEKGLMVVDAVAHGRAGHAARNEGDNAIYHALRDIDLLARHSAELFPDISPLLGAVRTSVTIIQAGTQHNVVPDACRFTIDVRSTDRYDNDTILSILRQRLTSELTPRSTRLQPSFISPDHPLVRACTAMGMQPFGSPTLSDQALMRFPSIKLGPGESARSHTADEYILLSEIETAIGIYDRLIAG